MSSALLSTVDNPYNPHTQPDDWYRYDMERGYYTLAYLARVANPASDLSESEADQVYEDAMNEIVRENVNGMYIKVDPPE